MQSEVETHREHLLGLHRREVRRDAGNALHAAQGLRSSLGVSLDAMMSCGKVVARPTFKCRSSPCERTPITKQSTRIALLLLLCSSPINAAECSLT